MADQDYRDWTGSPPDNLTVWGSDNECSLDTCPIRWTLYQYRPSLPANAFLLAGFTFLFFIQTYLGFRWRSWGFMTGMLLGCACEVVGYTGRILLWDDPFSYDSFMIQIICLTTAPVFFAASIYVTLSRAIIHLAPELSRFKPKLFIWIFIPADVVCFFLQSAGGTISADSEGDDKAGVDITIAGLVFQVFVILSFIVCLSDYMIRYLRSDKAVNIGWRVKTFFAGLSIAILFILGRCAYRVAELKDGYQGDMVTHEPEFIAFEGAFILIAATALCFGHPGLAFKPKNSRALFEKNMDIEGRHHPEISQPRAEWNR